MGLPYEEVLITMLGFCRYAFTSPTASEAVRLVVGVGVGIGMVDVGGGVEVGVGVGVTITTLGVAVGGSGVGVAMLAILASTFASAVAILASTVASISSELIPQATVSNRSIAEKRVSFTNFFIAFPLESNLSRKASLVYSSSFARIAPWMFHTNYSACSYLSSLLVH